MDIVLPDLCDAYPDLVRVATPIFQNFGGRRAFGGQIVTIKCHEDNSLVAQQVALPGHGKVLVVDGGGSLRCGLLGDNLAQKAFENHWQGIVINGCIRDVDIIGLIDLGVQALACHPMKSHVWRHRVYSWGVSLCRQQWCFGLGRSPVDARLSCS